MDRIWAGTEGIGDLARHSPADVFALPSRSEAILALRPASEAQGGPMLLTGEAGVGKTWLWRRLQAELPLAWRWVSVDIPPALDPTALHGLIGYGLGLPAAQFESRPRLALTDFLRESSAEGVSWGLVLDEAHNASATVLEEIRLLANRLGRADGLAALLLAGQTSLARRLAVRPRALAVRLTAHVHLRGLEVDEARLLVERLVPGLDWDESTLERHHRDTGGNPRRLLLTARRMGSTVARKPLSQRHVEPIPAAAAATTSGIEWETPIVGPLKPPLMVGDGMIEVGWEAGAESVSEAPASSAALIPAAEAPAPAETETINDHYAALQAWNEWARNQGREGDGTLVDPLPSDLDTTGEGAESPETDHVPAPTTAHPSVWSEGQQGFAPYGQLFSRLKQVRDANESS